jgi:hypothetical protein
VKRDRLLRITYCCWQCAEDHDVHVIGMLLCPTCGNKRCPHATDHRHECTGSNEAGQPGSIYGHHEVRKRDA